MPIAIHRPMKFGARFSTNAFCFPVVLGAAGLHLVCGFHIEQLGQIAAFGAVQVALHQAQRDRGPMCQRPGEFRGGGGELFIGDDTVDETER